MTQSGFPAIALPLALMIFSGDLCEARSSIILPGVLQTQAARSAVRAKFGDLPKDLQEKARRLGYKEDGWVEMQQDSTGAFTVLPPKEEARTPEAMKAKLNALVQEKIVKDVSAVSFEATLATDGTGFFTVRSKFESLMDAVQDEAGSQGYKSGDEVLVQVDAVTWAHRVVKKDKPLWTGHLQKVIPPKEPNGKPSFVVIIPYDKVPESLMDKAEDMGYKKGEGVRVLYDGESKETEVLRPQFRIGIACKFDAMQDDEKEEARDAGYEAGKTVWKKIGKNLLTLEIVPASEAGDGPLLVMDYTFKVLKDGNIALDCLGRFENLDALVQVDAVNVGYAEGDTVRVRYLVKEKQFKVLPRK
jgi:hypothetical protein